jgi:hypothetical protein
MYRPERSLGQADRAWPALHAFHYDFSDDLLTVGARF